MTCQKEYATINGQERYDQINREDFKVDLKKFIDPKSNKIKFNLNAVIKLLPYNGFYPQQRTTQIAGIFNKVYLDSTGIVTDAYRVDACSSSSGDLSSGSQGVYATLAATQPLFAPGILFNTIKSGIAVDWPTYITSSNDCTKDILYTQKDDLYDANIYSLGGINHRLPFETILDPYKEYISACVKIGQYNTSTSLPYLEPSTITYLEFYNNLSGSVYKIPYISLNSINKMNSTVYDTIYKSAINNFLFETVNFFLKNKKLNYFISKKVSYDEEIARNNKIAYSMDIIIRKNFNFSMFNQSNYSGSNQYIPSGSLFGPPCSSSHQNENSYLPYTPPYLREDGESRIRILLDADPEAVTNTFNLNGLVQNLKIDTSPLEDLDIEDGINFYHKMTLDSCLNLKLLDTGDQYNWYIQTKFETPLINFSKCSKIELTGSNNILKDYLPY